MTHHYLKMHYDAVIVGARCAGAATALLLARQGARVLIVDREAELGDTLSTHALMRPAVSLLDQWGLLGEIVSADTPAVENTQFHYGTERVDIPVKPFGNARGLYAPRRWLLDRVLRDAAVEAGAELHTGVRFVSSVKAAGGHVVGAVLRGADGRLQTVSSRMLIGADGRNSAVAADVGSFVSAQATNSVATVYTYVSGLPNNGYRWYYGEGTAAAFIPTTNGQHCFGASCAPGAYANWFREDTFAGALNVLMPWEPEIVEQLKRQGPDEKMRRYLGARSHIRDCSGPGWALVGDAGFYKDPATAHGITDAFLDAQRLANAISRYGQADAYQADRDQFAPALFKTTNEIASLDWDYEALKSLHMDLTRSFKAEQHMLSAETDALAA